jgi:hypothetical protein
MFCVIVFWLYPVLSTTVFHFMYLQFLMCAHIVTTGDFYTNRSFSGERTVMTSKTSFLPFKLWLYCVFLWPILYFYSMFNVIIYFPFSKGTSNLQRSLYMFSKHYVVWVYKEELEATYNCSYENTQHLLLANENPRFPLNSSWTSAYLLDHMVSQSHI